MAEEKKAPAPPVNVLPAFTPEEHDQLVFFHGPNQEYTNEYLLQAIERGDDNAIREATMNGANWNVRMDRIGETPFCYSCRLRDSYHATRRALNQGASHELTNIHGQNALEIALALGHNNVVQAINDMYQHANFHTNG
jgi:ankyrin repeat protein